MDTVTDDERKRLLEKERNRDYGSTPSTPDQAHNDNNSGRSKEKLKTKWKKWIKSNLVLADAKCKKWIKSNLVLVAFIVLIASCVPSSLVVSFRLMETLCFQGFTLEFVHWMQFGVYVSTIALVLIALCFQMSRIDSNNNWHFAKILEVVSLTVFSFFPVTLNVMIVNLLASCYSQIYNETDVNSIVHKTAIIAEIASEVSVSLLVVVCTAFLIILQTTSIHKSFCTLEPALGAAAVSLLLLWVSSVVEEVAEATPLHNYKTCFNASLQHDCHAMDEDLASLSSMFTPLTIEYCIVALLNIVELWNELGKTTEANSDNLTPRIEANNENKRSIVYGSVSSCGLCWIFVFCVFALIGISAFLATISNVTSARKYESDQQKLPDSVQFNSWTAESRTENLSVLDCQHVLRSELAREANSSLNHSANWLRRATEHYFGLRIGVHIFSFSICIIMIVYGRLFLLPINHFKGRIVNDFILALSSAAVVVYCTFAWLADATCFYAKNNLCYNNITSWHDNESEYGILELVDYLANVLEIAAQTLLIFIMERLYLKGYLRMRYWAPRCKCVKIPFLSGAFLFLALINITLWGADSFHEVKSSREKDLFNTQRWVYGPETWNLITQMVYPTAVYFRFHSAMIFFKAFYDTLSPPDLIVAIETTSVFVKEKQWKNDNDDVITCWRSTSELSAVALARVSLERMIKQFNELPGYIETLRGGTRDGSVPIELNPMLDNIEFRFDVTSLITKKIDLERQLQETTEKTRELKKQLLKTTEGLIEKGSELKMQLLKTTEGSIEKRSELKMQLQVATKIEKELQDTTQKEIELQTQLQETTAKTCELKKQCQEITEGLIGEKVDLEKQFQQTFDSFIEIKSELERQLKETIKPQTGASADGDAQSSQN